MSKKILFCTESSHISSGFGNFSRAILSRLYSLGYDVAELSCYRTPSQVKIEPWKIYPAALSKDHPKYKQYSADISNSFGKFIFDFVLLDYKPDIVIDFRDFWMFAYQEISPLRKFFYWMIAPTFDSSPLLVDTMVNFSNADMVLTHTKWANDELSRLDKNRQLNLGGILSDSVDTNIFKPVENKNSHKLKYNLSDAFIIGSVLRNQKRKLIPELFDILRKVLDNNPNKNILLYLHTSYPEIDGWNIPELLLEYNVANYVLFTYRCNKCHHFITKKYHGPTTICNNCKSVAGMCSVTNGISESDLSDIYNLFDIYIQYAICEGFGIPQVEAVACGVPLITIDHGAMGEIGRNLNASLVKVKTSFREADSNAIRIYPDNNHAINVIESLLNNTTLSDIGHQSRKLLLEKYSWDKTTQNLIDIIDNIELSQDQGKWDLPTQNIVGDTNMSYDGDNKKFINYIVENIIKEPILMKTSYIMNMIYNLNIGVMLTKSGVIKYDINNAIRSLDLYLQHKVLLENIRTNQKTMPVELDSIMRYSS